MTATFKAKCNVFADELSHFSGFCLEGQVGVFPVLGDCASFAICDDIGAASVRTCPKHLLYDAQLQACTHARDVDCDMEFRSKQTRLRGRKKGDLFDFKGRDFTPKSAQLLANSDKKRRHKQEQIQRLDSNDYFLPRPDKTHHKQEKYAEKSRRNNSGDKLRFVEPSGPDVSENKAVASRRTRMVHHVHSDTADVGLFKVIRSGSDDLFDRDVIAGFDLVAGYDSGNYSWCAYKGGNSI